MATVLGVDGGAGAPVASDWAAPELRAVVEVDDRVRSAAAQLPGRGVAVRLGSADSPVRVVQNSRLSRTATGGISSGATRRSGAWG